MGRKKIKIQPIKEDRNRSVTYLKRKAGLFKKAHELAVLTDSQVAVIVFGHNGKLAEFCSTDIDLLLLRYTEYDGAAEKKGPQHYLNLDKDSDDNDDNDNDNDDQDSGDGRDDSFASQSGFNGSSAGRGASSSASTARSTPRTSGVKRKAESASTPRSTRPNANQATSVQDHGGFGAANSLMGVSPSAKQTINAAIRQKSQNRSGVNLAAPGQLAPSHVFDPFSFGQPFIPGAAMSQGMAIPGVAPMQQLPGQASANATSANLTRAQTIANMSIPMPTNDRLPIFVQPATPGFGLTPGGTVTTPGGRRFSFSDVLTRGSSASALQRPVTANSMFAPTIFPAADAFGFSATPPPAAQFASISPSVTPQPPPRAANSSLTAPGAGNRLELSPTPFPDLRSSAHLMTRPASTGMQSMGTNGFNDVSFASASGSSLAVGSDLPADSPANIMRPFTACANLDAPGSSSLPPTNAFSGSLGAPGLQASSATPELIQPSVNAASSVALGARASTASMSTDEETPPGNVGAASLSGGKLGTGGSWLNDNSSFEPKTGSGLSGQATLVQPVPVNPTQGPGSVPFDLNYAANPTTGL